VRSRVPPDCHLAPATPDIVCARIGRDGETAFFLVNTSAREYEGMGTFRESGDPVIRDPVTGAEHPIQGEVGDSGVRVKLSLKSFASIFVVFGRKG